MTPSPRTDPRAPLAETIAGVRKLVLEAKRVGKRVGLVPTMGALHAGHAALIRAARAECEFVAVSVFVNPAQFGPQEDLGRYPRTLEADRQLCGAVGADVVFFPSPEEIYPPGFDTWVEVHGLDRTLCGPSRPGHFRGVTTVVMKLFQIVGPDTAWFGQKDAQQAAILVKMTRELNVPVEVRIAETIRESDGLAMSSRNRYLDPVQRSNAAVLYRTLQEVQKRIAAGETSVAALEGLMLERLSATTGARVDYASVVDASELRPVEAVAGRVLVAVAVFFGTTRLIDNVVVGSGGAKV